MLLGNSAPTFILLHSGNSKARAVKGLYEHLVDMSQPDEAVAETIKNILKSLLGDQWDKVYIPPKTSPVTAELPIVVPDASREDADKLVDDFLSDLETSGFSVADDDPPPFAPSPAAVSTISPSPSQSEILQPSEIVSKSVESDRAQAINEDLAELLIMEANKARQDESPVVVPPPVADAESEAVPVLPSKPATAAKKPASFVVPKPPVPSENFSGKIPLEKPVALVPSEEIKSAAPSNSRSAVSQAPLKPAAADFRISQDHVEEQIPEDLLLAFEENYRSETRSARRTVIIALVCIVSVAGGWYLVKQKPQLVSLLKQRFLPASASKQAPLPVPVAIPVQKPLPPPVVKPVVAPSLPSFIPKEGHDASYALTHPGWERYAGKNAEFRIFTASGRPRAVQVLAVKETTIPESLMKSVMQELVGSPEYQIASRSTKAGVRVENGTIRNKGEVVIYRRGRAVKAFVVSIN